MITLGLQPARYSDLGQEEGTRACSRPCPRATVLFITSLAAFCLVVGMIDSQGGGLAVQRCLAVCTWLFLLLAVSRLSAGGRLPVLTMVAVATAFECCGSLLWGLYQYRYHNLPLYVPPGHGLFYLAALRVSALERVRRWGRTIVWGVAALSALSTVRGLLSSPVVDLEGSLWWFLLVVFLVRGRDPVLFAVTFALTMALEYYGTAVGAWHWVAVLPGTSLSAANPPSAVGAGYCVLDACTMRVVALMRSRQHTFIHTVSRSVCR